MSDTKECETKPPQSYLQREGHNGGRRQAAPPQAFWYPDLPVMDPGEAARRMGDGSMWIRSVHFEFYYSYAVVEDSQTAERYVAKGIIGHASWAGVCAPLHEWS